MSNYSELKDDVESAEEAQVVAYRYRVKGDPRGWEYSSAPLFGPESEPGPREEYQALSLGRVLSELTVAKEENERVCLANLDVMNHYEDARDEAEGLRGRVSELEAAVENLRTAGNRVISYGQPITEWTVAVQDAFHPEKAQRLRQQADEAEQ